MKTSRSQLVTLLKDNVCEVKFVRRAFKAGSPPTRRMLCTNSFTLLNSENGRLTLNFRPTANFQDYNPATKNLIIVWDIFMQNYRQINCDNVELIQTIPANEDFWKYYVENLQDMTQEQKINFQNT